MFEYGFLQQYWWFIISLLGGLLVFLMFVQGANAMIFSSGRTEEERTMIVNSTGRKWEFTFTTLVTFGGAFFASFPLFYSTSFGGAYWVWVLILVSFVFQAVSYEFQRKAGNILGRNVFRAFLVVNGFLGPFFVGVAPNLLLGFAVVGLTRVLGSLYMINNISDETLTGKIRGRLVFNAAGFLLFFLAFLVWLFTCEGFAVSEDGTVFMEKYKYWHNLLQTPPVLVIFLAGTLAVLYGILKTSLKKGYRRGIWWTGAGTVLAVTALFMLAGYNGTAYYPSTADLQASLTVSNSCSSEFTLKTMTYVSFIIPFVLAYIAYAWRAMDRTPITAREMDATEDKY